MVVVLMMGPAVSASGIAPTAHDGNATAHRSDAALWPVEGELVRRFTAPPCERCRGPRGVEFAVPEGSIVRASVSGEVSFVGQVSRRVYVVQRLGNGVLLTYGWLAATSPGLTKGRVVPRGAELGRTGTRFYLGARVHGRYVDPLMLLGFERLRLVGPGAIGRLGQSR